MDCSADDRATDEFEVIDGCFEIALPQSAFGDSHIIVRPDQVRKSSVGKPFILLSQQSYSSRRIITCMICRPKTIVAAMKRITIIEVLRKERVSGIKKLIADGSSPPAKLRRTKEDTMKRLAVPEIVTIVTPPFDGVPSVEMRMMGMQARSKAGLYVELTPANLEYIAKAARAQYHSAPPQSEESQGEELQRDDGPQMDEMNMDESHIDDSCIDGSHNDESIIDVPPVVGSTEHLGSQPASASIDAAAVDDRRSRDSVLAMLCRQ